jgi:hypothetical protein
LGDAAEAFYEAAKESWRWNSRYWEQSALLMLAKSDRSLDALRRKEHLEEALQRARYSVAIEEHPFGLTTLARVLMSFGEHTRPADVSVFNEGLQSIQKAIALEDKYGRMTPLPFSILVFGTLSFLSSDGHLTSVQRHDIGQLGRKALKRWPNDREMKDAIERLLNKL